MVRARYSGQPLTTHQKYELDTAANRSCQTEDNRSNASIFFLHAACPLVAQLSAPATPASGSMTTGMDATGCACVCVYYKGMRSYAVLAFVCVRMCVCMCVAKAICKRHYGTGTAAPACSHLPARARSAGLALREPAYETGLRAGPALRDRPARRPTGPALLPPASGTGLRGPAGASRLRHGRKHLAAQLQGALHVRAQRHGLLTTNRQKAR